MYVCMYYVCMYHLLPFRKDVAILKFCITFRLYTCLLPVENRIICFPNTIKYFKFNNKEFIFALFCHPVSIVMNASAF